jgi:L-threonylcarbamoyladenylate synthase
MKKTIVIKVNPRNPEKEKIRIAAKIIRDGGIVAFPTETVYGLGADALNPKAVLSIFRAKRRPLDNPPIVHISSLREVKALAENVSPSAKRLMRKFWPGPLTLVFKRSSRIPAVTVANLGTVALRMPDNRIALSLLRESGRPIAAPSANLSGKPSPTTAKHVIDDLDGRIDAVIDGGHTRIGVESTVIDFSVNPPQLLRPGGLPFESIKKIVPQVVIHPSVTSEKMIAMGEVRSPGMAHRHYAPKTKMTLVEGDLAEVRKKIIGLAKSYRLKGERIGILATDETKDSYGKGVVMSLGSRSNLKIIAKNLFRMLREIDSKKVDIIIAEGFPAKGIGLAIANRMRRASSYRIIKV